MFLNEWKQLNLLLNYYSYYFKRIQYQLIIVLLFTNHVNISDTCISY
jgi:hypothetical protein